jgi:hypothetical protein
MVNENNNCTQVLYMKIYYKGSNTSYMFGYLPEDGHMSGRNMWQVLLCL